MTFQRLDDSVLRETLWRDARVRIHTNIAYQQARWRILERRENIIKVISLLSASTAFYDLKTTVQTGAGNEVLIAALALIVLTNAWALVFQWGAKARDAAKRVASWSNLESQILRIGLVDYTEKDLASWDAQASDLEKDEPAANSYLVARAEREARRLYPTIALSKVGKKQSWWAWLWEVTPRPFLAIP